MTDITQRQIYTPWTTFQFPEEQNDLLFLSDGQAGLSLDLIFHQSNQLFRLIFEWTYVYRVIDEGYRLKQLGHLPKPISHTIYTVSHSAMIAELLDESCESLHNDHLIHYLIVTDNDCIDVITGDKIQPVITHQEEPYRSIPID